MADQVQTPETGGGEGAVPITPIPAPPAADAKPEAAVEPPKAEAPAEIKPETPKEVNPEVPKEVKPDTPKEENPEAPKEAKPEQPKEVKLEELKEEKPEILQVTVPAEKTPAVKPEANGVEDNAAPKEQGDWEHRESELLKKIEELEKVKKERAQDSLLLELKVREEEIDLLKARVNNLETELQAALSKPSGKNHEMIQNIKLQHEELLSKARGMIFDKTKMVKNQELQIEALTTQIQSLKDINQITKDLLEIRNSEIKAMEDRLQAMEARFKAEKDRFGLVLQRAQTSSNINDDLRKEYETQLVLFKELREKYDQRVKALVAENERLKGTANPANDAGASADAGSSS